MMRARVGAQFATLLTFVAYVGMSNFDMTMAPMYQASQKRKEAQRNQDSHQQSDDAGKEA